MRVIFNCRVVNSSNPLNEQLSYEGVKHNGTNLIGRSAARSARVIAKSSDSAPRQCSRTLLCANVRRLMAVEPPQQKLLFSVSRSAEAIEAFQTERKCAARLFRAGTNQR